MNRWSRISTAFLSGALLMVVQGCANHVVAHSDHGQAEHAQAAPASSERSRGRIVDMLDSHLQQLENNLEALDRRIEHLEEFPETSDPIMRELRALDLAAWELHREQWRMQQDHLTYTHEQLKRAQENPAKKSDILKVWEQRQGEYEASLHDFRQQRHELEEKRVEVEARLIRRYLE